MDARGTIGAGIWSLVFYLAITFTSLFLGIGIALALFSVRHILLGIPIIYKYWRKAVFGEKLSGTFPQFYEKKWPNLFWILDSLVYTALSISAIHWFNFRLIVLFSTSK